MRTSSFTPITSSLVLVVQLVGAQEAPVGTTASSPAPSPATTQPGQLPANVSTSAVPTGQAAIAPSSSEVAVTSPAPASPNPATFGPADGPPDVSTPVIADSRTRAAPTTPSQDAVVTNASGSDAEVDADSDAPPGVQLEAPEPSQGHFVAVGFHGIGAMAFDDDRGTREPTFGNGFTLRLGESITDWLSLSLAFGLGDTYGPPRDHLTFGRFGITSQWYFSERWFAQAGFGAANIQGPDPDDHDLSRGRYGDVYLTGLGYNFYLSDSDRSGGWVFTPILTAEVGPDSEFTTTSLWLGVEFSWWTGLTRDKLDLPTSRAYTKSK